MSKGSFTAAEREQFLKELLEPPEIRPMCSHMELRPSGTQLIMPFPTFESENVALVSVWTMALRPDNSKDLDALHRHVISGVEKLASIAPEFISPMDRHALRTDNVYERPQKYNHQGDINNVYVIPQDGDIVVQIPMLLSDALHVYGALQGVVVPGPSIAASFEYARWMEIRGPIAQLDDPTSTYTFKANSPDNRLGMFEGVLESELPQEAKKHIAAMRVAGIVTDEEAIQHLIGLAVMTAYGQLPNPNGQYPVLTDAGNSGKAPEKIVTEIAQSMLGDVLEMMGQSPGALADKAFDRAAQDHGPSLKQAMAEAWKTQSTESFHAANARNEEYQRRYKGKGFGLAPEHAEKLMAQKLSDMLSGKKIERKSGQDSRDIATISNIALGGFQIPPFIPRTYTYTGSYDEVYRYTSRPPGHIYPPVLDLPENLKPFVQKTEAGANPKAAARLMLSSPS